MSRFGRIVSAVFSFLAALVAGRISGYTAGYNAAHSQPQPASSNVSPFCSVLFSGSAMGVVVGTWIAYLILMPPAAVDEMAGQGEEDQR